MRQGYVIRKANKLDFSSSFRSLGHRASLGTYLLTLCLEGLILLAGIVATAIIAAILGCIGYGVSKIASYANYRLFILMFAAPSVIILWLYILVSFLIFSPTAYIIVNNKGVSAGETIGACYRSMINNGKMTIFLSYFVSWLLRSLYWAAWAVGGYFLVTKVIPQNYFLLSVVGMSVVAFAGYLTFAPILTLANRVVKEHLFEDIVLDPAVAARVNEKVNLAVCNGKKVNAEVMSQNLASLFDYTEDPYRILEETERKSQLFEVNQPAAEKKKDKKKAAKPKAEKAAVKKSKNAPKISAENKPAEVRETEKASEEKPVEVITESQSAEVNDEPQSAPIPTVNTVTSQPAGQQTN